MADPAWRHKMWSSKGEDRSPSHHYKTMGLDEIKQLQVGSFCLPDSFIWLWIPMCMIHRGESVLNAWGAEFVTAGFWGKTQKTKPKENLPKMGTGYTLREAGEGFMIGRIGRPRIQDRGIPSLILEPRREHSRKPEQGYDYAERMVGKSEPKLDLFSRQVRAGWDNCGDELDKFDAA